MKKCAGCGKRKPSSGFHRSKQKPDGLQPRCKVCNSRSAKIDYRKNNRKELFAGRASALRERLANFVNAIKLEKGCTCCPERAVCCLDFHHLDSSKKDMDVSFLMRAKSSQRLIAEIQKCVLVCSNCHRKIHAGLLEVSVSDLCVISKELLGTVA